MNRIATLLTTAVLAFSAPALAHDYSVGALKIGHPWARPTPTGAIAGAGYLTVTNTGKAPDRLLGGSTPVSDKLEVHEMSMTGGVMRMRPVEGGLTIAPGQSASTIPFRLGQPGQRCCASTPERPSWPAPSISV